MTARAVMVLGTSSHAGKSLLTTALCRIFAQQKYRVAPFKSQNMSLNSAATIEGLEIGRAQALQAEAAGVAPSVHMNPILLKPSGKLTSQIVVRGRIWGRLAASDYHLRRVEELMPILKESYSSLAAAYDVVVLEGAGSPAEINLKQHDIVNMRMAELANASCLLVGDIDRGGVFASLLGTVELLEPEERERIKGFVVNKFRGDIELLSPGLRMMEDRLRKPCLGVVPYIDRLNLEEEDSQGLVGNDTPDSSVWLSSNPHRPLRVAVIAFPSLSNFTDFDALHSEPSVSLRFCRNLTQLRGADIVILPGSKQTIDDLKWLRAQGLQEIVIEHACKGLVTGICGGMQMMGRLIFDPEGMETAGCFEGLGLLPINTTMRQLKVSTQGTGELVTRSIFSQPVHNVTLHGYEIHVGETTYLEDAQPFAQLTRQSNGRTESIADGCITPDTRVFGTYLHGLFDDDSFRHAFIRAAREFHHLVPASELNDWKQRREESFGRLAATVSQSLDLPKIFSWVDLPYRSGEETR